MSDATHQQPVNPDLPELPPGIERQDNEVIQFGRILALAAASLTLFIIGIIYALWLLNHDTGAINQRGTPTPAVLVGCKDDPNRCTQVGIVERRPIPLEQRAQDMKKAAAVRLGSYGWIDQSKNVTHIPIDEAMKKVSEGERP